MPVLRAPRHARATVRRPAHRRPPRLWIVAVCLPMLALAAPVRVADALPVVLAVHSQEQQSVDATTAEVLRLTDLVEETRQRIAGLEDEALLAAGAFEDAEYAAGQARQAEMQATAALDEAETAVRAAEGTVGVLARNSYMTGGQLNRDMLLLDASSPSELIERAGLLDALASYQVDALDDVQAVQNTRAAAAEQATTATRVRDRAETVAADLLAQNTRLLAEARNEVDALSGQLARQQEELTAARVALYGAAGEAQSRDQAASASAAAQAAAAADRAAGGGPVTAGNWAAPLEGQITSQFGSRWGSMHYGVDIAAPMYTPIYSAGDGVVVQAGSASGFGQAVYIQHDNGDVTVYGHIETFSVSAGQRVVGGQEIAGVGNRGFSTGPHLHFEVQQGGMGGTRVDPLVWLADRGIYL